MMDIILRNSRSDILIYVECFVWKELEMNHIVTGKDNYKLESSSRPATSGWEELNWLIYSQ